MACRRARGRPLALASFLWRATCASCASGCAGTGVYAGCAGAYAKCACAKCATLSSSLGFFYVVWLALAYLLTRRKTVNRAQTWSFTGLLALGIFEYQARILSFDFLQEQVRSMPSPSLPLPARHP